MVQSSSISITPANHADRHRHGGADPLTGDVRITDYDYRPFTAYTDVTGSRASDTVYQNTGDTPMFVSLFGIDTTSGAGANAYTEAVDPPTVIVAKGAASTNQQCDCRFIVPPGWYYKIVHDLNSGVGWFESV